MDALPEPEDREDDVVHETNLPLNDFAWCVAAHVSDC